MRKTLLLACAALLSTTACKVYKDEAAQKKIAGIAQRSREDRDKSVEHATQIKYRLDDDAQKRSERIDGYLARRAAEPARKLERERARISEWRADGRELARRDELITDVTVDMTVDGTVKAVEGETVRILGDDGREYTLKAAKNSHVVADNREIPAATLPVGFPVSASFGSIDGESYYYEVVANTGTGGSGGQR